MTEPAPLRPKGVPRFPLKEMHDGDFEEMVARLIRLEHPDATKPADTKDGGADMLLPKSGGGYTRAWQCKHFPGLINWTKCDKSLAAARENYQPDHYTFVFPRNLTKNEQKTFDRHFKRPDIDIPVDYWNGTELEARLAGTEDGKRVATTFFESPELDRELTYRAIEAGGRIETIDDVLDRSTNLGHVVAGRDAFFSYPLITHESEQPEPPGTPGSVMSYATSDGTITSRTDVVPRDDGAMERYGPMFELRPTQDDKGRAASEALHKALSEGTSIDIDEGMDFVFTKLPPAMKDMVGRPMEGGLISIKPIEYTRRDIPPWAARIEADTDRGQQAITVELSQTAAPPDEWDDAISGEAAGLHVLSRMRWRDQRDEISWNFRYTRDDSPAAAQLAAVNFMLAACGNGKVTVTDLTPASQRPPQVLPREAFEPAAALVAIKAFLEDVVEVEQWTGVDIPLPPDVSSEEARSLARTAHAVRNGGMNVTWHNATITIPDDHPFADKDADLTGKPVRYENTIAASLFGHVVPLGLAQIDIEGYVASIEPSDEPGHVDLVLTAPTPDGLQLFERIVKTPTPSPDS